MVDQCKNIICSPVLYKFLDHHLKVCLKGTFLSVFMNALILFRNRVNCPCSKDTNFKISALVLKFCRRYSMRLLLSQCQLKILKKYLHLQSRCKSTFYQFSEYLQLQNFESILSWARQISLRTHFKGSIKHTSSDHGIVKVMSSDIVKML